MRELIVAVLLCGCHPRPQLETTLPPLMARLTQPTQRPASWHAGVIRADLSDGVLR